MSRKQKPKRASIALLAVLVGYIAAAPISTAHQPLPLLSALVSQSVLRRSAPEHFDPHRVIQRLAAECLADQPAEQAAIQGHHARYYLAWFQRADGDLRGPAQREALADLATEMDNFRAAWD
jgi:hypothetical protein